MGQKKAFVIRIDPEKLKAIEKWAYDEFRSTNGQIEWIIDRALKEAGRYIRKSQYGESRAHKNEPPG